jgi:RHS repeat-associated protein
VEAQGPSPNGSGVAWARTYLDGLGRTYKKERRGPTAGQEILSGEVTFNPRRGVLTSVHQNLVYTYYPDGMIQTVTSPHSMESWSYAYDDLNRLLSGTNVDTPSLTQSFTYNEIGNITYNSQIGTYTYPNPATARPHAVSTAGARSHQYDAIGQMTSRNGTVIQWNGDGKPSSIGNVGFTYDGVGERLKKVSGGQTTRYIGGDYEIAPDGTVTKYLVGGKQVGTTFFIHHRDHLGSIQVVTDSLGSEVRRQKHKPFGDQHYVSGSHLESKGWIGEREEETELLYLNARYYDPEIGRFTAPDSFATPGQGLNRYTYAFNDPANLSDASGLWPCSPFDPLDTCNDELEGMGGLGGLGPFIWEIIFGSGGGEDDDESGPAPPEEHPGDTGGPSDPNAGGGAIDPPPVEPSPPGGNNTPQPDNPLYNCQNGLKTNCPGNRSGGSAAGGTPTSGGGEGGGWSLSGMPFRQGMDWSEWYQANWRNDWLITRGETLGTNPASDPTLILVAAGGRALGGLGAARGALTLGRTLDQTVGKSVASVVRTSSRVDSRSAPLPRSNAQRLPRFTVMWLHGPLEEKRPPQVGTTWPGKSSWKEPGRRCRQHCRSSSSMTSSLSARGVAARRIFSVGDCPVCADSGAVLLLKAAGSARMVLFCPLCGVAWPEPPTDRRLDEIKTLQDLAPSGVMLPTSSEAMDTGFALTEVAFEDWFSLLQDAVKPLRLSLP